MNEKQPRRLALSRALVVPPLALFVAGVAAAIWGLVEAPARTWSNLLVDSFYVLSLGVSGIFFIATQRLSSARWSAALRRVPEALMLILPAAAVLAIVIFAFGRHALYPWADPHALAHHGAGGGKLTYLQPGFVLARVAVVLLVWLAFAWLIRRASLAQDGDSERSYANPGRGFAAHRRLDRLSGLFAPVYALTFTVAAYDWIISLEPEWFSTMFAVYVFAGMFVQGIATVALTTVLLARRGYFGPEVGEAQFHDLGKMLFAFSTFWAYIWVCQYLLIWYGNIPEEVTYYVQRTGAAWLPLFLANLVINWIVPFFLLLPVASKRSPRVLASVSVLLLVGHWLDLFIMVVPARSPAPEFGALEILLATGAAGLAALLFLRALSRAPLVPTNDPLRAAPAPHGGES